MQLNLFDSESELSDLEAEAEAEADLEAEAQAEVEYLYYILMFPSSLPVNFWDPIPICLTDKEIMKIKNIHFYDECFICTDFKHDFKKLSCCKKSICLGCSWIWFKKNVYCPFCKADQRT